MGGEDDNSEGAVEGALGEEEGMEERMEPNDLGLWEIEAEPPSPLIEVSLTPDVFAYHELNQPVLFEDMTIIVRSQGDADSSAQRCLISEELFHNFGIPTFKRKNPGISKIDGFPLEVLVRRAWNSLPYSYRGGLLSLLDASLARYFAF